MKEYYVKHRARKHQAVFARDRGLIALITVIIIGASLLTLGITASFIGQTEIIISGQNDREYVARTLLTSCVEEASYRLKLANTYTGGTILIGSDTCAISISGSGSTRTVVVSASSGTSTKSATVELSLKQNSGLYTTAWGISSWNEADPL